LNPLDNSGDNHPLTFKSRMRSDNAGFRNALSNSSGIEEPDAQPMPPDAAHSPSSTAPRLAWITACLLSAAAAFFLGRASARSGATPASAPAAALLERHSGLRAQNKLRHPNPSAGLADALSRDQDDSSDPIAKKQAEIVAMLSKLKDDDPTGFGPAWLGLITWVNTADEESLVLLFGTAKALMPESPTYSSTILSAGYTRWTQLDPQAAFDGLLALDDNDRSEEVARVVLNGWLQHGPPRDAIDHGLALLKADSSLSNPGDNLVGNMLVKLYQTDPALADEIALGFARSTDELEQEIANSAAFSRLGELCDKEGPKAALEWIANWPTADTRTSLNKELIEHLINGEDDDAHKTAIDLFRQFPNPDPDMFRSVAEKRAKLDLTEAQAWALNLPSGDTRKSAVLGIVNTMDDDRKLEDAIHWLSTLPPDEDLDGAFGKIALSTLDKSENIGEAVEFSKRIVNPDAAAEVQSELIQRWLSMNRDNAVRVLGPAMEQAVRAQPDAPAPQ
jgi:hypothetical protein